MYIYIYIDMIYVYVDTILTLYIYIHIHIRYTVCIPDMYSTTTLISIPASSRSSPAAPSPGAAAPCGPLAWHRCERETNVAGWKIPQLNGADFIGKSSING